MRLRIQNSMAASRELSAFYYVDWCLSDTRVARGGACRDRDRHRLRRAVRAQPFRRGLRRTRGVRRRDVETAFRDRRPVELRRPQWNAWRTRWRWSSCSCRAVSGPLLDPCGAVQAKLTVPARETVEVTFLLGEGADEAAARTLVGKYHEQGVVDSELGRVIKRWNDRLRAVEVETPDSALDIITNRWLPYQTLSCRFHARSAFYQSGGAFGFRDQLQDVLALSAFRAGTRARAHPARRRTPVPRRGRSALVA